jgi:hypothetical protein
MKITRKHSLRGEVPVLIQYIPFSWAWLGIPPKPYNKGVPVKGTKVVRAPSSPSEIFSNTNT